MAREFANKRSMEIASSFPGVRLRVEVRVGKPHEVIASTANDVHASVVVIGPHGDRPRPWRFLGTTADRVVRSSPVPVLVATTPTAHPPRRILVPVDDDSAAQEHKIWNRLNPKLGG